MEMVGEQNEADDFKWPLSFRVANSSPQERTCTIGRENPLSTGRHDRKEKRAASLMISAVIGHGLNIITIGAINVKPEGRTT